MAAIAAPINFSRSDSHLYFFFSRHSDWTDFPKTCQKVVPPYFLRLPQLDWILPSTPATCEALLSACFCTDVLSLR